MGGAVGFTIRTKDGTVHRMSNSTGILPWAVKNTRLLNERFRDRHIQMLIKSWNKEDQEYREAIARDESEAGHYWWLGHYQLAPVDYGLVVIDLQTMSLLSSQWYTSISHYDGGTIYDMGRERIYNDADNIHRFQRFIQQGRVKECRAWTLDRPPEETLTELTSSFTEAEAIKILDANERRCSFRLDMSPFQVFEFEPYSGFQAKLIELGFTFTTEEEATWYEWNSLYIDSGKMKK